MNDTLENQFRGALNDAIKTVVERAIEDEIKKVHECVVAKVRGEVGAIVTRVFSNTSFERIGRELVIHVEIKDGA